MLSTIEMSAIVLISVLFISIGILMHRHLFYKIVDDPIEENKKKKVYYIELRVIIGLIVLLGVIIHALMNN